MAAKKRSSKTKQVTLTMDADALENLTGAIAALSEVAAAAVQGADDPAVRRALLKKGPAKKRATKKRR